MKELTNDAPINDTVYEMNPSGSHPIIKLTAITIDIKEHEAKVKENKECGYKSHPYVKKFHILRPEKEEKALYNQPIPVGGEILVYNAGNPVEETKSYYHTFEKGKNRISTSKKVMARGPLWIWAAIAVGLPPEGSTNPYLVVESADRYGSDDTTEGEIIGFMEGKQREMTARLVRRAHLLQLPIVAIRTEYKYTFVEPDQYGIAKVKEG